MPRLSATEPQINPDCLIVNSTFGAYCEVGSGSRVLNSRFEDYAYCDRLSDMIVAGVPASPLRARFAPKIAERLLALAWWDWSHPRLRATLEDFRALPAEAFLEKYDG